MKHVTISEVMAVLWISTELILLPLTLRCILLEMLDGRAKGVTLNESCGIKTLNPYGLGC